MQNILKYTYKTLYTIWAWLFALTAILGLLFPGVQNAAGRFFLALISVCFFIPPWLILTKARAEGSRHHLRLVRYLAVASLSLTLLLFCAGIWSLPYGQPVGDLIHILMTVLCAPLVCSNYYVLPMFGWATLLTGSFGKEK